MLWLVGHLNLASTMSSRFGKCWEGCLEDIRDVGQDDEKHNKSMGKTQQMLRPKKGGNNAKA